MKNILIITIGTRDVQTKDELIKSQVARGKLAILEEWTDKKSGIVSISKLGFVNTNDTINLKANTNPDYNGFYIFPNPRIDGETLTTHMLDTLDWLTFPLVEKPLDWIHLRVKCVNFVLLVFTDQPQQSEFHWRSDTLHFNKLVKNFLQQHPATAQATLEDYPIKEQPVNIDYQYNHFEEVKGGLLALPTEEIENIYLLAQGGIDQINTALTLKLIEHFPNKVIYLQQPEDKPVVAREFPSLFIRNLTRAKAISPLNRYEFATIKAIVDDQTIKNLAQVGIAIKSLKVDDLKQALAGLFAMNYESEQLETVMRRINTQTDDLTKQELLFCNVLVELNREEYNDALWRLRTLGEVLLAPEIKDYLSLNDLSNSAAFTAAIQQKSDVAQHLLDKNVAQKNGIWEANAFVLRRLFDYRYPKKDRPKALDKAARVLESVGEIRNQLVHSAQPVSQANIEAALNRQGQSLESVEIHLRTYFDSVGINIIGFGIYDTIRDEIKQLL